MKPMKLRTPEVVAREALLYATGYADAVRHMAEAAQEAERRSQYRADRLSRDAERVR